MTTLRPPATELPLPPPPVSPFREDEPVALRNAVEKLVVRVDQLLTAKETAALEDGTLGAKEEQMKRSVEEVGRGCLVTIAGFVVVWPYSSFVEWKLWTWFFVPLGLPAIGYVHMFGVSMTIGMMTLGTSLMEVKKDKEMGKGWIPIVGRLFIWTLTFGMAYVVKILGGL